MIQITESHPQILAEYISCFSMRYMFQPLLRHQQQEELDMSNLSLLDWLEWTASIGLCETSYILLVKVKQRNIMYHTVIDTAMIEMRNVIDGR